MLALDPPGEDATIGGLVATGDSGPLRHRYLAPRDLVIGMKLALSDGSVATAGGTVIKNVAGYDLSKLFTGSYGTLGLIAQIAAPAEHGDGDRRERGSGSPGPRRGGRRARAAGGRRVRRGVGRPGRRDPRAALG